MKVIDCVQQTDKWFMVKKGIPSASGFSRIITSTGKASKSVDGYISELIADSKLNCPRDWIGTDDMIHGNQYEPVARDLYAFLHDKEVEQVGFCLTDNGHFGCSPDGFIDDRKGGVEIKCPRLNTHIEYVMKGKLPTQYKIQVHGCMYVTGCKYWDFMSWYKGQDPFIIRIEADEFTESIGVALDEFYIKLEAAREKFGVKI